jgi:hypothetical protein
MGPRNEMQVFTRLDTMMYFFFFTFNENYIHEL